MVGNIKWFIPGIIREKQINPINANNANYINVSCGSGNDRGAWHSFVEYYIQALKYIMWFLVISFCFSHF